MARGKRRDDESVDSDTVPPPRKRGAPDSGFYDNGGSKRARRDDFGNGASFTNEYNTKIDFTAFSMEELRAYMDKFDLVPPLFPLPSSGLTPPPPTQLLNPPPLIPRRELSPSPLELSTGGILPRRRRAARVNDDSRLGAKPILSDIAETHRAMAVICTRHHERETLRDNEVTTIASFLYAARTKERSLKIEVQL